MRYTRINCMPFQATMEIDRIVQADDRDDALRQACLCLDRELEEITARINTQNVTDFWIEPRQIDEIEPREALDLWNPTVFPKDLGVPRYLVVKG